MADKQPKNKKNFKLVGGQTIPGNQGELTMPPHASNEIASKYIFSLINGGFNFDISLHDNTKEQVAEVNAKYNTTETKAPKKSKASKASEMDRDN